METARRIHSGEAHILFNYGNGTIADRHVLKITKNETLFDVMNMKALIIA